MPAPPVLAIRADGGPGIGVGHLARTLALAQAWIDRRGTAVLVTEDAPAFWSRRFEDEGCRVTSPREALPDAAWWIVDGYELGGASIAPSGARVLVIDDDDAARTGGGGAALVLDPNLGADPRRYPLARAILAGPRFALISREIEDRRRAVVEDGEVRRLVVVLGGAPSEAVIALGDAVASDPRLAGLEVRTLSGAGDAAAELSAADLVVAAAGTVSWEVCCLGLPSVLVPVAANQVAVARELDRAGAAVGAEADPEAVVQALLPLIADPMRRRALARSARALVDGAGARRVACRLRAELLRLRDVTHADAEVIYGWNNDALTRSASFATKPIEWAEHVAWLERRLATPSAVSYVAGDAHGDIGLVRFDERDLGVVEVGVTVAPERRGEGWGGALVDAACRRMAGGRGPLQIEARIKAGNLGSVRAFVDADFDESTSEDAEVLRYARVFDGPR